MAMYSCRQKFVTLTVYNVKSTFVEFGEFFSLVPILHELRHKHSVSCTFSL
jgi:hypothetical protein